MDVVTEVGMAPVRLHVRDCPEQVVRQSPLDCGPLKNLVCRTSEMTSNTAEDVFIPARIKRFGSGFCALNLQLTATRHWQITSAEGARCREVIALWAVTMVGIALVVVRRA